MQTCQRNVAARGSPTIHQSVALTNCLCEEDGTTRFCMDYRKLNDVTRKDAYPLLRIDDTLDVLCGAKVFTNLDLASGYWQVKMSTTDREVTTFATRHGLFEFQVMSFAPCNAPGMFQRLIVSVLA